MNLVTAAVFTLTLLSSHDTTACNNFERVQSIILSEATRQPLAAQVEVARVAITKGACFVDPSFYAGYGVALRAAQIGDMTNHHWKSYFAPEMFPADVRESVAVAAHRALTEPRVERWHFDRWDSQAWWWDDVRACPNGWAIMGEIKFC